MENIRFWKQAFQHDCPPIIPYCVKFRVEVKDAIRKIECVLCIVSVGLLLAFIEVNTASRANETGQDST